MYDERVGAARIKECVDNEGSVLDLRCCNIKKIDWDVLKSLKNLISLDIGSNDERGSSEELGELRGLKELLVDCGIKLDSGLDKLDKLEFLRFDYYDLDYVLSVQDKLVSLKRVEVCQYAEGLDCLLESDRIDVSGFNKDIEVDVDMFL